MKTGPRPTLAAPAVKVAADADIDWFEVDEEPVDRGPGWGERLGSGIQAVGQRVLGVLGALTTFLVDRVVAAIPVVGALVRLAVPPLTRLAWVVVAPTCRVQVHAGLQHLALAEADNRGFLAITRADRHLPLAFVMRDPRWNRARGPAARRWLRAMVGMLAHGVARSLARSPRQRAELVFGRCQDVHRYPRDGIDVALDPAAAGRVDDATVAMAKVAGARLLPVACAAEPAWLFVDRGREWLVPMPLATIHLAVGAPVPVDERSDSHLVRHIVDAELADLQDWIDDLAGLGAGG